MSLISTGEGDFIENQWGMGSAQFFYCNTNKVVLNQSGTIKVVSPLVSLERLGLFSISKSARCIRADKIFQHSTQLSVAHGVRSSSIHTRSPFSSGYSVCLHLVFLIRVRAPSETVKSIFCSLSGLVRQFTDGCCRSVDEWTTH